MGGISYASVDIQHQSPSPQTPSPSSNSCYLIAQKSSLAATIFLVPQNVPDSPYGPGWQRGRKCILPSVEGAGHIPKNQGKLHSLPPDRGGVEWGVGVWGVGGEMA